MLVFLDYFFLKQEHPYEFTQRTYSNSDAWDQTQNSDICSEPLSLGGGREVYVYVFHTKEILCDIPVYNLPFSS